MTPIKYINTVSNHIQTLEDISPLSTLAPYAIKILNENMEQDPGHDTGHIVRVVRNAIWFSEGGNLDVIIPAAILHDLVNVPKDSPDRSKASLYSANLTINCFYENNATKPELWNDIHHAIVAHSWSANVETRTIEAKAIQDADRIEALGAIGISRLFSVGTTMGLDLFHPTDPLATSREIDESKYTLDHFFVKLDKLASTMKTPIGRQVAEERTQVMRQFIGNLVSEIKG